MRKKKPAKTSARRKPWWQLLDEVELNEAYEEATVDCYGDEAQSCLLEMVLQDVETPFVARVLGQQVQVVGVVASAANPNDVDFVCAVDGQQYPIAARSVQLEKPLPEGHLYLAALFHFQSRG